MIGFFIIHPSEAACSRASIATSASSCRNGRILPNNTIPNTLAMEFNWLTINGKAGPATTPMVVKQRRARAHPARQPRAWITIRSTCTATQFYVTGTEGGRVPAIDA